MSHKHHGPEPGDFLIAGAIAANLNRKPYLIGRPEGYPWLVTCAACNLELNDRNLQCTHCPNVALRAFKFRDTDSGIFYVIACTKCGYEHLDIICECGQSTSASLARPIDKDPWLIPLWLARLLETKAPDEQGRPTLIIPCSKVDGLLDGRSKRPRDFKDFEVTEFAEPGSKRAIAIEVMQDNADRPMPETVELIKAEINAAYPDAPVSIAVARSYYTWLVRHPEFGAPGKID